MVTSPLSVWKARRVCCLLVLASLRRKQLLVCVCGRKACRVCFRAGWEAAPGWSLDNFLRWAGLLLNQPLVAGCGAQEGGQRGRRALPLAPKGWGLEPASLSRGLGAPRAASFPASTPGFAAVRLALRGGRVESWWVMQKVSAFSVLVLMLCAR